ncbi:MAG: hypothetical protein MSB12_07725 [Lentisphaeraceae bacterium]|nr:hypothetical protein [Lentisphaeraceae bacterium]
MASGDFPYALDEPAAWRGLAPESLRAVPCLHAPAGTHACCFAPESKVALFRQVAALGARSEVRCLLLAEPERAPAEGEVAVTAEDLRRWLAAHPGPFPHPLGLLCSGAPYPCGSTPLCETTPEGRRQDEAEALQTLFTRSESLAEAIEMAFGTLPPQEREFVHAWAHRPDPNHPSRPIAIYRLADQFHFSRRKGFKILAAAKTLNPTVYARLDALRKQRLRKTGAWQVRG